MSRLPTMWMPIYNMTLQLEKLLLQFCTSKTKHQLMHKPKGNLQLKLPPMDLNLLLQGQRLTRSLTFAQPCDILEFPSEARGDNRSVVTSSTIPNSTISKRHHLASYHRVREAIAAKYISFHWKDGKSTLLTSSANIGSLQLCGPCSSLSCFGGASLPPS